MAGKPLRETMNFYSAEHVHGPTINLAAGPIGAPHVQQERPRCPGHLEELEEQRIEVQRLLEDDGMTVVGLDEWEFLTAEGIPSWIGTDDVEDYTFDLPEPDDLVDTKPKSKKLLRAYRVDADLDAARTVKLVPESVHAMLVDHKFSETGAARAMRAAIVRPPSYRFRGASDNFTFARRTWKDVYNHIEHTTESSGTSAENWFANAASDVSSHLVVYPDGSAVVMVADDDIAWTAGNWNFRSLNNENVGYAGSTRFSEENHKRVGHWIAHHFTRFRIPFRFAFTHYAKAHSAQGAGLMGHLHVPLPSTHTDPGFQDSRAYFWERRMYYARKKAGIKPYAIDVPGS